MKRAGATPASGGGGGGSVLKRIVTAPVRALRRARDLYVRSMTRCAGAVGPGAAVVGFPGNFDFGVPRNYSFRSASRSSSSGDDDLRELVRAASQRAIGSSLNRGHTGGGAVRRSQSVGMGRIDEDAPCDFGGLDGGGGGALAGPLYPRSRSCAVVSKRKVGALQ